MSIKCAVVLALVLVVAVVKAQDITPLLQNRQLVSREIGCVLNRYPCDVIGRQIKSVLPEALNNGCARCTPQQAQAAKILMNFMRQSYPQEWLQIVQMYGKRSQ